VTDLRATSPAARAPLADLAGILIDELRPYEGRLRMALHIAFLCAATAVAAMMLRMPEALVACYLVFFAYKDNAGEGIAIGVGLIVAATLAIAAGIGLLALVADAPGPRFALILALTILGMFLWRASRMGPVSYALAFILAFILMLADTVPVPELLVRALLWLWLVVAVPMALLVVSNVLAGRSPLRLARRTVAQRLAVAAGLADGRAADPAPMLEAGNEEARGYLKMARLLGQVHGDAADRLAVEIDASYRALAAAAAMPGRSALAPVLRQLAGGESVAIPEGDGALPAALRLLAAARDPATRPVPPPEEKAPFFKPDAFTNPAYIQFSLKVALAVAITYVTVLGLDLFDIHTAMVTCFFVAVGTGGEVFHKSSLRIAGCLVGTLIGAFAVRLAVPHMTDAGHLFVLVFAGSFVAAWVALGSWRVQYLGWQMALAFFICVLPGSPLDFAPNTDLSDAGYRILGIVLGISVMGLVFALIWPESAQDALARETDAGLQAMAESLRGADQLEEAQTRLGAARNAAQVMAFERLGARQAGPRRLALRRRLDAARGLVRLAPALADRPGATALAGDIDRAAAGSRSAAGEGGSVAPDDDPMARATALLHDLIRKERPT